MSKPYIGGVQMGLNTGRTNIDILTPFWPHGVRRF